MAIEYFVTVELLQARKMFVTAKRQQVLVFYLPKTDLARGVRGHEAHSAMHCPTIRVLPHHPDPLKGVRSGTARSNRLAFPTRDAQLHQCGTEHLAPRPENSTMADLLQGRRQMECSSTVLLVSRLASLLLSRLRTVRRREELPWAVSRQADVKMHHGRYQSERSHFEPLAPQSKEVSALPLPLRD